jgi:hypothetical protein
MCYGIQSDAEGKKMMMEKASTLNFGSLSKGIRESEMFRPDERNADAEALICLNCPLPECKKNVCQRYNEEVKKIKEQDK